MSAFLYYLPGLHAASRAEIKAAGLGYAFSRSPATVRVAGGPDGQGGIVLADEAALGRGPSYARDGQAWRRIPGLPAWVGRGNEDPLPGPADLARDDQLDGHWLTLGDDRAWLCPVARGAIVEDGELRWFVRVPRILDVDEEGNWYPARVAPRFARLWQIAERWAETHAGARRESDEAGNVSIVLTVQDAIGFAVESLAANYRLGVAEAGILGLLTKDLAGAVLDNVIDMPGIAEALKKKLDPAGGRTADGPPG
jgi:hypothetical protein